MFTMTRIPSVGSVLSSYTSIAASAMVARTVMRELQSLTHQFIPHPIRVKILDYIAKLINLNPSPDKAMMTITIEKSTGFSPNELFSAVKTYLGARITPSNTHLKASKTPREAHISLSISRGETIVDSFDGIDLRWRLATVSSGEKTGSSREKEPPPASSSERTTFQLSFEKEFVDKVVELYLPHVMEAAKEIKAEKKKVRLFSLGMFGGMEVKSGPWSSVDFDHPSTFETMAMEEEVKKMVVEDLDRFVERKEFYKRVGKAWKRGYLLYGPPGTGKSSLVAAMANYLKFDVYDLQLSSMDGYGLRQSLVSVPNKSIIVIEDIDCSVNKLENRANHVVGGPTSIKSTKRRNKLMLSELLNFADGLWSSLGDERIIVFTTNYKDRLDPALLRPGRMDMHIHLSYLTPSGFKTLAFNYLRVKEHPLFGEIKERLKEVEVTPAEVAEKLMRSDNPDVALGGLVEFLQRNKAEMVAKLNETVTRTTFHVKNGNCDGKNPGMEVEECDGVKRVDKTKKRKKDMVINKEKKSSSSTTKRCKLDILEPELD
ncbi:putative mitochondrial chaperone bcs1 [Morus notabilis]|uniref:Putative mitochondrial chaperone bcs1 n=1 Tax=Morus notabilis TaxID=981085 RepID=W9QJ20_9ROSA|nr:AAA-ATPase At3g50940 [Morus notabilis]EXB24923.1 putative mitochondrial chaperone bcs1 [Morus notabilis]